MGRGEGGGERVGSRVGGDVNVVGFGVGGWWEVVAGVNGIERKDAGHSSFAAPMGPQHA